LLIGPVIYFLIDPKRVKKWIGWLVLFAIGAVLLGLAFMFFI
jgi:hypothetical protein